MQMPMSDKMLYAQQRLRQRFHAGLHPDHECIVILDVMRLSCHDNPTAAIAALPDFYSLGSHYVRSVNPQWFQPYRRVAWFKHQASGMKIRIESEPLLGSLAPYRVSIYADDQTGLRHQHVFSLLEIMPIATLTFMELAFDFCLTTDVTRKYVRRHGIFGKSWRMVDNNPVRDRWGSAKGTKIAKSYYKGDNASHRVELVFRQRYLRPHKIRDPFDFGRFVQLLPKHHIHFARLDKTKLLHALKNRGLADDDQRRVLCRVTELEADLSVTLRYLRGAVGLKNVRRLLVPLAINKQVREGLEVWAAQWPTTPSRLELVGD
jgi:hypothetical protein